MSNKLDQLIALVMPRMGLKLTALLLATVSWLYIRDATSFQEVLRDVPLTISTPEGWAVQESSANSVAVTFRGSQDDIRNLERSAIRVQATAKVQNGEPKMMINLGRANVASPRAVRALYVTPSEVLVTLDRETEKEVRVDVQTFGSLPEGYFIEDSGVSPGRIKIFGPARRLAEIDAVSTQPLDLAGRIRSFSNSIPLVAPSGILGARMDVQQVSVNFTITEFTVSREFKGVPVKILLPPGGASDFRFSPEVVNVMLKGRVNVISNLTDRAVNAFVDFAAYEDLEAAALPVEVNVTAPGVTVITVDPPAVRLSRQGAKP